MRRSRWTASIAAVSAFLPPLACPAPVAAQGCGPTRLKVSEAMTLDAAPAKVWAMIGDFQDMSWDVDAVATRGSGGNAPDKAARVVTWRGGATFGESLYKYDAAAMSYTYHIDRIDVGRLPIQNASMTLEVAPAADGKSRVLWHGAFYRYLAPGEGAPDAADARATQAVRTFIRSALDGLKTKADTRS